MRIRSIKEYSFFLEAWILLHASRLIILFFPFKKIASFVGVLNKESNKEITEQIIASDIKNAIRRATRYTLHSSKCYDQALAGKFMLKWRRLPSTIYFGLSKKDQNNLIAHAWLRFGSNIITGEKGVEDFTIVAFYGDLYSVDSNSKTSSQS
jgi:hypothetical protein